MFSEHNITNIPARLSLNVLAFLFSVSVTFLPFACMSKYLAAFPARFLNALTGLASSIVRAYSINESTNRILPCTSSEYFFES